MHRILLPFLQRHQEFHSLCPVKNGNVVCLLVDTYLFGAVHSLLKKLNKLIVYFVNIFSDFF